MKYSFYPLYIIAAAILWGVDGSVLRPALYHLDVKSVVLAEHLIAFMLMSVGILILYFSGHKKTLQNDLEIIKGLSKKGALSVFWFSLFGGLIGTLAITKALFFVNFVPLSIPILIQKLQPIFAILMALLILKEKPNKQFYNWAFLALIGSYIVTFGFSTPEFNLDNKTVTAALLGLTAAFAWGSSTVFGRAALNELNFRTATYLRFGLTSLFALVLLMIYSPSLSTFSNFSTQSWLTLLIIALTSGGTAMFLYYRGLKHVRASAATLYELSMPITVIVLDYLLYDKILSWPQFLGAGLMLISITMISNLKSTKAKAS